MSKTLANLRDRLSEAIGDYLHKTVTTAINADNSVISTTLTEETSRDDYFNRSWCLITSENNDGTKKKISDYASAGTLTVFGSVLVDDGAALATFEIHKYDPDNKRRAINSAARAIKQNAFRVIEWDDTLVGGSHLPNAHFEDWSQTTYPDYWQVSSVTALENTTYIRGGTKSIAVTRAGTDGYAYCSEAEWGRLINLQDETVDYKCWVRASTADQAYIEIYTKQADGTEQTLTSSAHSGGGEWELLELEDQVLNDHLTDIQCRLKVITADGTVYFDAARVTGAWVYEYLLPLHFQGGHLGWVYRQLSGQSDDICDDVFTSRSQVEAVYGWNTFEQNGVEFLRLPFATYLERKLILSGYAPLESNLSADTDTMTINDPYTDLLISYAAYLLFEMEAGLPSAKDRDFLRAESVYWLGKSEYLNKSLRMAKPQSATRFLGGMD